MATSLPVDSTYDATTDMPAPPRAHFRDKADGGGSDNIASSDGTTAVANPHPMLPADEGALGIVGPIH